MGLFGPSKAQAIAARVDAKLQEQRQIEGEFCAWSGCHSAPWHDGMCQYHIGQMETEIVEAETSGRWRW